MSECLLPKITTHKGIFLLQAILYRQNKRSVLVQERLDIQCGFNITAHV